MVRSQTLFSADMTIMDLARLDTIHLPMPWLRSFICRLWAFIYCPAATVPVGPSNDPVATLLRLSVSGNILIAYPTKQVHVYIVVQRSAVYPFCSQFLPTLGLISFHHDCIR